MRDSSLEIDHFNFENQCGVGRDHTSGSSRAVRVLGWTSQDGLLAFPKLEYALIPTSDHLSDTNLELKLLPSFDTGVEHSSVGELTSVVNCDHGSLGNRGASCLVLLVHDEALSLGGG